MAPTETYVDPAIAGDSGAGTIGDPYGDLQYALNTMTRDSTNGDRINIKAGTDEVLGAALSLATYGTPSQAAPIIFQGYTSAAGDGGIGGISGGGTYAMFANAALDNIQLVDLHMHNCGSADVVNLDNFTSILNCEIDNTSGNGITIDNNCTVRRCYIHNVGGYGVDVGVGGQVANNVIVNGTNDVSIAIRLDSASTALNNIASIDGASRGIVAIDAYAIITGNTVYSSSGTGQGIQLSSANSVWGVIINNYVEGFSGVGGVGYDWATYTSLLVGHNYAYNNTTNFGAVNALKNLGNNTALGSSPLTNPGSGDFSVSTALKALGYPSAFQGISTDQFLDVGAAQREEAGTGGAVRILPLLGGVG